MRSEGARLWDRCGILEVRSSPIEERDVADARLLGLLVVVERLPGRSIPPGVLILAPTRDADRSDWPNERRLG